MHTAAPPIPRSARLWLPVAALGGWSAFLWLVRIKNALGDDAIDGSAKAIALVTSVAFLVAAGVVVVAVRQARPWARRAAAAFAVVSIVYWCIRVVTIIVRDHPVGFTVVHSVLGMVTVGLGVWVIRAAGGAIRPTA